MTPGDRVFVVSASGYQVEGIESVHSSLEGAMATHPNAQWEASAYQRGPRFRKSIAFTPELARAHPHWEWEIADASGSLITIHPLLIDA